MLQWLRPEQYKILKQIILLGDRNGIEIELGRIFYKRTFRNNYNLKKQGAEDAKSDKPMAKFIGEYPKQENYPVDEVDVMILGAVRDQFPKSITRSDTMFHDLDIEKLKKFKSRNVIPAVMYFYPDLSNIYDIYDLPETARNGFKANVNIYTYSSPEILQNQVFHATFDLNDHFSGHNLKTVEFE
ncbi:MAG TPA: hypothetical protein VGM30_18350 [Puia sp.]